MQLEQLTLRGFKSIRELKEFPLRNLNVLIGANGAGKSNFISFFKMLSEMVESRLQYYVAKQGGADTFLFNGVKVTKRFDAEVRFGKNSYMFSLEPDVQGNLFFAKEEMFIKNFGKTVLGSGHKESPVPGVANFLVPTLQSWRVYHFHDTSETAGVKRPGEVNDNKFLRSDASNLAAFLLLMRQTHIEHYKRIRDTIRLVAPFFDDFILDPAPEAPETIRLEWRQRNSDFPFRAHHLSDGTLRFICLATLLLQPFPPATVLIDEPELGLHPYAISTLASLIHMTASRSQVILSTQSMPLVDEFRPEDLIVVDRKNDQSVFERPDPEKLQEWLKEYSLSQLWGKNVLGGRP
ncbi:MAG TPA: AAA family ATPase [Candidatus Sulfotelmatobacter sp.]|nr:AAA family ATPase [Candidatus Sulfotelmatobacter sp.]